MEKTCLQQKKDLRRLVENLRVDLSEQERKRKSAVINAIALSQPYWTTSRRSKETSRPEPLTLFTYMPLKAEVDITPIIKYCWKQAFCVVVPKIIRSEQSLSLHVIRHLDDLEPGFWGIAEPKEHTTVLSDLSRIDLMLVPGIAFDHKGGRLGFGGGYYDRFMERFNQRSLPHPMKVALAFHLQVVPEVPMEHHDLRVDQVITEQGCLIP